MQPGNGWFVAILALLTVIFLVAIITDFDTPSKFLTKKRRWLSWSHFRRGLLIVTAQVLIMVTAFSYVNFRAGFFATWSEVFGDLFTGSTNYHAVDTAKGPHQLDGALKAAKAASQSSKGVIVKTHITGRITGYRLPARIYFPAEYFEESAPERRFPVVQFFAGYPGGIDVFGRSLYGDDVLNRLIANKEMPPTIFVMAEQYPKRPANSECTDSRAAGKAETYLTEDVPEVLRNELRVAPDRAGWALMGYSTGAFCALNLGLRHSDRYCAIVGLSSYFSPLETFKDDEKERNANDPTRTVTAPHDPLAFYLLASTGDRDAMRELADFAPTVRSPDTVQQVIMPGGHSYTTWRTGFPDALNWLGRVLTVYPPS